MDYIEQFNWSQRWIMDNFPPLPFVQYVSPCYDPYEIDPSHYTNNYDYNYSYNYNLPHNLIDNLYHNSEHENIYNYDSETDSDDDLEYN